MRRDGYTPIREYAAIGDGRTAALIALDGSIDWLCLPDFDSPSVFAALLDAERGGRFALEPETDYESERRYVPSTNVLETTFRTSDGVVRVTDALTLPGVGLAPNRELVRRIEGLAGSVALRWQVEPRFEYAGRTPRLALRHGCGVAESSSDAIVVSSWDAGAPAIATGSFEGRFVVGQGGRALLVVGSAHQEPLVLSSRDEAEGRLDETVASWARWADNRSLESPWREAVIRSGLALKLLVFAPSGAVLAAPTTSLPERIGGERNWDYRFSWVRDSAFTVEALLDLGCSQEADAFVSWLSHASQLTHPRLQVLYRLNGDDRAPERSLPLSGYRGSRPVRIGNGAVSQRQLDVYGDLIQTAWLYTRSGAELDPDIGGRVAEIADHVCGIWREPDSGIWEVRSGPLHFTQSKMMCFVALTRAAELADEGAVPASGRERWRREAKAIREFVETECVSPMDGTYVRAAGSETLDASLLLASLMGYASGDDRRLIATIDAVRDKLGHGPLLYRYIDEDGVSGEEGAFLACSFWLVEALARARRVDEAAELMEQLLALSNDVGLYAEEVDPETGDFLGNFPQGLVHLALVSAAACYAELAK
jgi:GH15 family glucan-1,4-alpha-glucosidase